MEIFAQIYNVYGYVLIILLNILLCYIFYARALDFSPRHSEVRNSLKSTLFGCLQRIHHRRTYTIKLANFRVSSRSHIYFTLSSNLFVGDLSSLRLSRSTLGSARKRVERKRDKMKVELDVSVDATLAPNALNQIKQTRAAAAVASYGV